MIHSHLAELNQIETNLISFWHFNSLANKMKKQPKSLGLWCLKYWTHFTTFRVEISGSGLSLTKALLFSHFQSIDFFLIGIHLILYSSNLHPNEKGNILSMVNSFSCKMINRRRLQRAFLVIGDNVHDGWACTPDSTTLLKYFRPHRRHGTMLEKAHQTEWLTRSADRRERELPISHPLDGFFSSRPHRLSENSIVEWRNSFNSPATPSFRAHPEKRGLPIRMKRTILSLYAVLMNLSLSQWVWATIPKCGVFP